MNNPYRAHLKITRLLLLSLTLSCATFAASNTDHKKIQEIIDTQGRTIHARVLFVGEHDVFLKTMRNKMYRYELAKLNEATLSTLESWKEKFNDTATPELLLQLSRVGVPKKSGVQPIIIEPDPSKNWVLVDDFSDEFNTKAINEKKWQTNTRPWGERAWSRDNLWQKKGSLYIQARYEPHTDHKGRKFFYKLGILQSHKKTTYGYFEARIKGCSRFPGLCPAFWLYSNGKELNPDYPHITYSEIDIIEMLQGGYDNKLRGTTGPNHMDCNLHTREIIDGVETWRRPQQWPEVCKNVYEAPWDPRDGFHTYACENTPEKITWYIDGIKVAESPNHNWHLPMNVTLTMELRPPLIAWAGVDGREPVPGNSTPKGFPTHMEVDYVRCWVAE